MFPVNITTTTTTTPQEGEPTPMTEELTFPVDVVNGQKIIALERVPNSLTDREGNPRNYKRVLKLLLEDDTVVYGCTVCGLTAGRPSVVRRHLGEVHRNGRVVRDDVLLALPVNELLDLARTAAYLEGRVEYWKKKFTDERVAHAAAERKLEAFAKLIKSVAE
jgi:hypothetical protein